MSGTLSIANAPNANPPRSQGERARFSTLKSAILQFLQPGVFPVLALALVVGGWSYGLKLSHYFPHTDVTKASTTRMWLDQRHGSIAATVEHPQAPPKFLTPQLCVFSIPAMPHFSREQALMEPVESQTVEFVSPLHPLRAPPMYSFLA